MKRTKILKTKITRISSIMLFLICSFYGLSVVAQSKFVLKKPTKHNTNIEQLKLFKKVSPSLNKCKSDVNWWEPDTIYMYQEPDVLHREIHSYNLQGSCLTELCQEFENNEWVNIYLYTYTYDANNNLQTGLYQEWGNFYWVNVEKFTATYNANNSLQSVLYQQWQNTWIDYSRTTYVYDVNNNLSMEFTQNWNNWENDYKYTYTYDENNNMIEELYQECYFNDWENVKKSAYTYDANNNILTALCQIWLNDDWDYYYRFFYTYDANNNVITFLQQDYWRIHDWEDVIKLIYTYDVNNNLITELGQEWNDKWVNSHKTIYTYDENNNLLIESRQWWWQEAWIDDYKHTYTYDENNNSTIVENSYRINGNWQLSNGTFKLFYNNMKSEMGFYGYYKVTATYEHFLILETNGEELPNILIYPNPTNNNITVNIDGEITVKLYNMLGKEVLSENVNGKTSINIGYLPNGVYNVQVFSGNKIIGYSKIVKQ